MSVEFPRAEDLRMDMSALLGAVWARWLRIAVVTLLLLAVTFGVLQFVPKMYESTASILVEDRSNTFTRAATEPAPSSGGVTIDSLLSSQIELVKSRDTLLAVVDSEHLRDLPEFTNSGFNPLGLLLQLAGRKPAAQSLDETVLQNLSSRLTVIRERDSAVISIFVRSADPDRAASLANAIAREHVRRRAGLSLSDTAEASAWLGQQIDALRIKVNDAETKVANFKVDNDIFTGSNNTSLLDQQLSDIAGQITAAQERRNTAQQRAILLRGLLKAGQPIDGVPDVRDSPTIQQLGQSKTTLQGELAQRSATLLPSHPTIKALVAQIKEIEAQIKAEGKRIASGLEAQVEIETGLAQSLQDDLTRAKASSSVQTKDSVTLDGLQREAKAQRDLLESYLLKYRDAASRTDSGSALPDVRVITEAAPSTTPASPKIALILGAVTFLSLALQIGGILFGELLSGRGISDRAAPHYAPEFDDEADPEPPQASEFVPESASARAPRAPMTPPLETPQSQPDVAAATAGKREPPLAPAAEPAFAPAQPVAPPRASRPEMPSPVALRASVALENLSADIGLGRVRIVLLAALADAADAASVLDVIVTDALRAGLTVARVDAGSGSESLAPGITDLCAELVSFGDVVHRVREGLAEVPWGHQALLERRSMRPVTLIEALTDIYDVVIVNTGHLGMASSLPVFAGSNGRLVPVLPAGSDSVSFEAVAGDAAGFGFEIAEAVAAPRQHSAVA